MFDFSKVPVYSLRTLRFKQIVTNIQRFSFEAIWKLLGKPEFMYKKLVWFYCKSLDLKDKIIYLRISKINPSNWGGPIIK
jgi:hypothetical protein